MPIDVVQSSLQESYRGLVSYYLIVNSMGIMLTFRSCSELLVSVRKVCWHASILNMRDLSG